VKWTSSSRERTHCYCDTTFAVLWDCIARLQESETRSVVPLAQWVQFATSCWRSNTRTFVKFSWLSSATREFSLSAWELDCIFCVFVPCTKLKLLKLSHTTIINEQKSSRYKHKDQKVVFWLEFFFELMKGICVVFVCEQSKVNFEKVLRNSWTVCEILLVDGRWSCKNSQVSIRYDQTIILQSKLLSGYSELNIWVRNWKSNLAQFPCIHFCICVVPFCPDLRQNFTTLLQSSPWIFVRQKRKLTVNSFCPDNSVP
jgi:hypothetical protein